MRAVKNDFGSLNNLVIATPHAVTIRRDARRSHVTFLLQDEHDTPPARNPRAAGVNGFQQEIAFGGEKPGGRQAVLGRLPATALIGRTRRARMASSNRFGVALASSSLCSAPVRYRAGIAES